MIRNTPPPLLFLVFLRRVCNWLILFLLFLTCVLVLTQSLYVGKRPVLSQCRRNCHYHLRPVALTSAVTTVCERVVLNKLAVSVKHFIDPLQFAYRKETEAFKMQSYSLI